MAVSFTFFLFLFFCVRNIKGKVSSNVAIKERCLSPGWSFITNTIILGCYTGLLSVGGCNFVLLFGGGRVGIDVQAICGTKMIGKFLSTATPLWRR